MEAASAINSLRTVSAFVAAVSALFATSKAATTTSTAGGGGGVKAASGRRPFKVSSSLVYSVQIFKPPADTPQYLVFWLIKVVADLAYLQAFVLSGMREVGGLGFCQA